jgi:acetyl-CoA carboxylase carboxyltransferase component
MTEDPGEMRRGTIEEMRLASAPWRAANLHFLDDVIAPAETRAVLMRALEIARGNSTGRRSERRLAAWPTSFRMSRCPS